MSIDDLGQLARVAHTACPRCGVHHKLDTYNIGDEVRVRRNRVVDGDKPVPLAFDGRRALVVSWSQYGNASPLTIRLRVPGYASHRDPSMYPCELELVRVCKVDPGKLRYWIEVRARDMAAAEMITEALRRRTYCGCCDGDVAHADMVRRLMELAQPDGWPTLEDVIADLGADSARSLTQGRYNIGGQWKNSDLYKEVVNALVERRVTWKG